MRETCVVCMPYSDFGIFVSPGSPKLPPTGGNALDFQLFRDPHWLVVFRQAIQEFLVLRMVFRIQIVTEWRISLRTSPIGPSKDRNALLCQLNSYPAQKEGAA